MGIYEDIQVGIFLELLGPFFFSSLFQELHQSKFAQSVIFISICLPHV